MSSSSGESSGISCGTSTDITCLYLSEAEVVVFDTDVDVVVAFGVVGIDVVIAIVAAVVEVFWVVFGMNAKKQISKGTESEVTLV